MVSKLPPPQQQFARLPFSNFYLDLNLFFAIKKKLDNQNYFLELLKCLNLFNSKIITRVQLMLLVVDILGRFPELLQRFKGFVRFSVPEEKELMGMCEKYFYYFT